MIITGYMIEEATRRAGLAFDLAARTEDVIGALVHANTLAKLHGLATAYLLITRVTVRMAGSPRQMSLMEAIDLEALYGKCLEESEECLRAKGKDELLSAEDYIGRVRSLSNDATALKNAVYEGRANKLDTDLHELDCSPTLFT